jgi:hypothetical protein
MNPSFNTVSQFAHLGVSYSITLSVLTIGGLHSLYWFLPISVGAAAVKEFWYDEKYETAEVRGSSLEDFIVYLTGISGAIAFDLLILKGVI